MNWKKERITPSIAQKYLATRDEKHQRRYREGLARNYAITMHNGDWGLTHQGLAFDENGRLIDGQHRLGAVILSGTTQEFWVCREIPEKQGKVYTLDEIDRGAVRTVGEQLQIRHGYKNGNATASAMRFIGVMLAPINGSANGRMDVARSLAILDIYKTETIWVLEKMLSSKAVKLWRRGAIYAPLIVARKVAQPQIDEFCEQLASGENLKAGNPSHSLLKWRCGDGMKVTDIVLMNVVSLALRKHYENEPLKVINKFSRHGTDFWLDMQPRNVQKVRALFTVE